MPFWYTFLLVGFIVEVAALVTKEKYFPTLSRTFWRTFKLEDNSYDKHETKVRIAFTIIAILTAIWGILHLVWGPCALGIC